MYMSEKCHKPLFNGILKTSIVDAFLKMTVMSTNNNNNSDFLASVGVPEIDASLFLRAGDPATKAERLTVDTQVVEPVLSCK